MSGVTGVRRSLAVVVVGLAVGVGSTACSTSNRALTEANYVSADGVQADSGLIGVRNLLIVSDGSGGTVSGGFYNNGDTPDSVVSISAAGADASIATPTVTAAPTAGPTGTGGTTLATGSAVVFGLPASRSGPQAYLTGQFSPGTLVRVQVVFAHAASLTLQVPVLARTGYYTTVPTAAATAVATPVATPSASAPAA